MHLGWTAAGEDFAFYLCWNTSNVCTVSLPFSPWWYIVNFQIWHWGLFEGGLFEFALEFNQNGIPLFISLSFIIFQLWIMTLPHLLIFKKKFLLPTATFSILSGQKRQFDTYLMHFCMMLGLQSIPKWQYITSNCRFVFETTTPYDNF